MRIWFLLAGLLLAPFLSHAQDIPFSRNFRATNAANLPFAPVVLTDWDANADPGDTDDALNQIAERIDDVELAGGIGYTPIVLADWDGAADPGDLDDALDQLAERVTDQADAGGLTYTAAVATDWDGDADPGDLDDAVNQLAERVDDAELASGIGYTPADGADWVNPDPTLVSGALDDAADRLTAAEADVSALEVFQTRARLVTVAAGAEAAEAITLVITVTDGAAAAATGTRLRVYISTDPEGTQAVNAAAFVITDVGDGSIEDSDTGNAIWICNVGGLGPTTVNLAVTDQAASGDSLWVWVDVLSDGTTPVYSARLRMVITFAA